MLSVARALLIGIDHYPSHRFADGGCFKDLSGAVNDVMAMASFLDLPEARIQILTSTREGGKEADKPTYRNILSAFKRMIEASLPGDHIWLHYSGHGGRTATMLPEEKGGGALDEVLVPCDIGGPHGRYLHDVELIYLLQQAEARQIFVTLVLDCCHSGGMDRVGDVSPSEPPAGAVARTRGSVDLSPPHGTSLVAAHDLLASSWRVHEALRKVGRPQQGFVLLAACRDYELAYEHFFEGKAKHGALTWSLLRALQDTSRGPAYFHLTRRAAAEVHGRFPYQTPRGEGAINRVLDEGGGLVKLPMGLTVMAVRPEGILFNGGRSHGIYPGMRLAVYDIVQAWPAEPVTRVTVIDEDGVYSLASSESMGAEATVRPGDVLLPIDRGGATVGVSVQFNNAVPAAAREAFMDALRSESCLQGLVSLNAVGARFQLVVDGSGCFQIIDYVIGSTLITAELPRLNDANAASAIAQCLTQLSWYEHAWSLAGGNAEGMLEGVRLELYGAPADEPDDAPFDRARWGLLSEKVAVAKDSRLVLVVENGTSREIHCSLLCLTQDASVIRLAPFGGIPGDFTLDPTERFEIQLRAGLGPGAASGYDLFKLLVTTGAADATWLTLPPLGKNRESLPGLWQDVETGMGATRRLSLLPSGRPWLVLERKMITINSRRMRNEERGF